MLRLIVVAIRCWRDPYVGLAVMCTCVRTVTFLIISCFVDDYSDDDDRRLQVTLHALYT